MSSNHAVAVLDAGEKKLEARFPQVDSLKLQRLTAKEDALPTASEITKEGEATREGKVELEEEFVEDRQELAEDTNPALLKDARPQNQNPEYEIPENTKGLLKGYRNNIRSVLQREVGVPLVEPNPGLATYSRAEIIRDGGREAGWKAVWKGTLHDYHRNGHKTTTPVQMFPLFF